MLNPRTETHRDEPSQLVAFCAALRVSPKYPLRWQLRAEYGRDRTQVHSGALSQGTEFAATRTSWFTIGLGMAMATSVGNLGVTWRPRSTMRRVGQAARRRAIGALGLNLTNVIYLDNDPRKPRFERVERLGTFTESYGVAFRHPRGQFQHRWMPARHVYRLESASVDVKPGLVYLPDGRLVAESSAWDPEDVFRSWPSRPRWVRNIVGYGDKIVLPGNTYYHWLLEDLPNFLHALDHSPNAIVLAAQDSPKYVRDFALTLKQEVRWVDGPLAATSLVFAARARGAGWPSPTDVHRLRHEFRCLFSPNPTGFAFVSRLRSSRSGQWENEALARVKDAGGSVLFLEELPLLDQVRAVSNLRGVFGPHGAGLSNQVWMATPSSVFEVFQADYVIPTNAYLSEILGNRYDFFIDDSPSDIGVNWGELVNRFAAELT